MILAIVSVLAAAVAVVAAAAAIRASGDADRAARRAHRDPIDELDFRDAAFMSETAAIAGAQMGVREFLAAGYQVADIVTVLYWPPDGPDEHGDGYRVTSVRRDEPGVLTAGRR